MAVMSSSAVALFTVRCLLALPLTLTLKKRIRYMRICTVKHVGDYTPPIIGRSLRVCVHVDQRLDRARLLLPDGAPEGRETVAHLVLVRSQLVHQEPD